MRLLCPATTEANDVNFQACPTRLSLMFTEFSDELFKRFSVKASSSGIPVSEMPRFADAIMHKSQVHLDSCVAFLDTKATQIYHNLDYLQQMANFNR